MPFHFIGNIVTRPRKKIFEEFIASDNECKNHFRHVQFFRSENAILNQTFPDQSLITANANVAIMPKHVLNSVKWYSLRQIGLLLEMVERGILSRSN